MSSIYQHIRIIFGKQNIAFLAKNVSRLGAYAVTNMLMCLWFPHQTLCYHTSSIQLVELSFQFNRGMYSIDILIDVLIFFKPFRNNEDFNL